jgi:hypothetical protein
MGRPGAGATEIKYGMNNLIIYKKLNPVKGHAGEIFS